MTGRRRGLTPVSLTVAAVVLASVAVVIWAGPTKARAASAPGALSTQELAAGAAHACIVGGPGAPVIDWSDLRNPILSSASGGIKDEAVVWTGGRWHLVFSYVRADPVAPGGARWDVATATSHDLAHWSSPDPWPDQPGVLGVASPDVVRDPAGGFVVTYQSDPGASPPSSDSARLFYRRSPDLVHWSTPHPLAQSLAPSPGQRMIDGALVDTGRLLMLGFKYSSPEQPDVFEIARSTTGTPAGPWVVVGRPVIEVDGGTIENYEFVKVGGRWRLVATSDNLDQPWLFTLTGDPGVPAGWLQWSGGRQLEVPGQRFDTGPGLSSIAFEHANSAYLCAAGSQSGHVAYLFYAGSTELTQFDGWGHARIGVARSTDLVHWQVPPG